MEDEVAFVVHEEALDAGLGAEGKQVGEHAREIAEGQVDGHDGQGGIAAGVQADGAALVDDLAEGDDETGATGVEVRRAQDDAAGLLEGGAIPGAAFGIELGIEGQARVDLQDTAGYRCHVSAGQREDVHFTSGAVLSSV